MTKLIFRIHAVLRMQQRAIGVYDARCVVDTGETIEDYPADRPYPSRLILGWSGNRPLHVVVAYNAADDENIVITVYEPDSAQWNSKFRRRT